MRTAISADDEIIRLQKVAGFVKIGKVAVGEDNDTLHIEYCHHSRFDFAQREWERKNKNHPRVGGWLVEKSNIPPPA